MPRYRKKPVEIEAVQWTGRDADRPVARAFLGADLVGVESNGNASYSLLIRTLESPSHPFVVPPGWWLMRGVKGEHYACAPDVFAATYEAVSE